MSLTQKDWVTRLPVIELALNMARSDTTGFSPFYLNYGRVPYPMIWEAKSEYPGVRIFAERIKDAILSAHDTIIEARVKQTHQANKHRVPSPFKEGDLVYVSTKNLRLPEARARKLIPKYIGPMKVLKVVTEGASYLIELPDDLKQRGVHPVFHAALLRVHEPSDDCRFPGRQINQFIGFEDSPKEWAVNSIVDHSGKGKSSLFKIRWKTGDGTWSKYRQVTRLEVLKAYLELQGVSDIRGLPAKGSAISGLQSRPTEKEKTHKETPIPLLPSENSPSNLKSLTANAISIHSNNMSNVYNNANAMDQSQDIPEVVMDGLRAGVPRMTGAGIQRVVTAGIAANTTVTVPANTTNDDLVIPGFPVTLTRSSWNRLETRDQVEVGLSLLRNGTGSHDQDPHHRDAVQFQTTISTTNVDVNQLVEQRASVFVATVLT